MMKLYQLTAFFVLFVITFSNVASSIEKNMQFYRRGVRSQSNEPLTVVFGIRQKNLDAIQSLLYLISDPDSPQYGNYLSLEEVGSLCRNDEALEVVVNWLSSHNVRFDITKNGDFIKAFLSTMQAEKMFEAEFYEFSHKKTGQKITRSVRMSLPDFISESVDFVKNVVDFPIELSPRHSLLSRGLKAGKAGDVFPAVLQKYYNIPSTAVGANTGINQAVFEALGQMTSPLDLSKFETTYGVKETAIFKTIGTNNPWMCALNPNNCAEASLDIQYMLAVAQGMPTWYWSIDQSVTDPFIEWAIAVANTTDAPLVHSISYGGVESEEDLATAMRFDQEVQKMGLRGITVLVASGDDGVANFPARVDPDKCGFVPAFPASCPHILSVGATQGPEEGKTEIACTSDAGGEITTGGGFSNYYPMPSYQKTAVENYLKNGPNMPPKTLFNTTGRGYPDVGLLGHNYEIIINEQTYVGSGTSASTPVFAGFLTLINNERYSNNKPALGFFNPALYKLSSSVFHDITNGTNNCAAGPNPDCCKYGFTAGSGWDPLTGFGSVDYVKLKDALLEL